MLPMDLAELLGISGLAEGLNQVEAELEGAVRSGRPDIDGPAQRVVLGGGKRMRPALALACAVATSGDPTATRTSSVLIGAVAVELVQAGSLVHDDLMDGAAERRGVPTVNAVEGTSEALLVGDLLLARAGQLAAGVSQQVAQILAAAIADLCVGQFAEVATLYDPDRSIGAYEASIAGKTAALFRSACEIGAASAGAPVEAVEAVGAYGTEFGMAFQIIDDVLDVVSTSEALGKPVGNDIREGVYSLPVLLALSGPDGSALRSRLGSVPTEDDVAHALTLVRSSAGVAASIDAAREHNERAVEALSRLPEGPVVDGLARLPGAYLDWVLKDKAPGLAVSTGR
jgi:geranylgeranyl pyrophosphate synthase